MMTLRLLAAMKNVLPWADRPGSHIPAELVSRKLFIRAPNRQPLRMRQTGRRGIMLTEIERLTAMEEIRQLKARYFRSMDTKDWTGLEAVFSDTAELDMRGEAADKSKAATALVVGAPNIMAFIRNAVLELVTVHHGHMPEIEITSPTQARGIWAMEDILKWPEGAAVKTLHGYGHYHETYRKTDAGWRIETSKPTRLRVDIT
jgi:hypothetical protein